MDYYLRQSTASQEMMIGPFLLATDGSVVTDLTIANTDIEIYKAGATTHVDKNSGGATHASKGMYSMVFDATDTDTIGSGVAYVQVAGALPCKVNFTVLDEAVYDVMFGTVAPSTLASGDIASITEIVDAIEAGDVGTGIATLISRIIGTLATGTHNPQSGDAYARIGAPIGASISADIADIPTVSEFNARTLAAADYTVVSDLPVAPDNASIAAILEDTGTTIPAAIAAIPVQAKKNAALANFAFIMTDSTNHEVAAGQTVTCTRSIDGGAFAAGSLANVTEVSNGVYNVDFLAADLNGDVVVLRATATGCDDTFVTIVTAK